MLQMCETGIHLGLSVNNNKVAKPGKITTKYLLDNFRYRKVSNISRT